MPPRRRVAMVAHQVTWPRKRGHATPARRAGGFTLLELILVLILISTVLALAAPSLRRFARARETTDAASHLLALTRLAGSQAAAQAHTWRLNIDPDSATYWLTVQKAGGFVEPEREYGRLFRLPDGVSVAVEGHEVVDGVPAVQFYPDGRSDPVTIELTDTEGRVLQITCRCVSEQFQIVTLIGEVES
jgi:prepilin-type N-terminal cleavage/methylation domain-containing protein